MKELLLSFALALVIGSALNGWNKPSSMMPEAAASDSSEALSQAIVPITDSTDATFNADVLKSEMPVLVDFWAEWCGPCKKMLPVIDQLASEYEGKIKVVRVDADNCPEVSAKFKVNELPTFMFFKNGMTVERYVGIMPKKRLADVIKNITAS